MTNVVYKISGFEILLGNNVTIFWLGQYYRIVPMGHVLMLFLFQTDSIRCWQQEIVMNQQHL